VGKSNFSIASRAAGEKPAIYAVSWSAMFAESSSRGGGGPPEHAERGRNWLEYHRGAP
jgi:hypothetical protein